MKIMIPLVLASFLVLAGEASGAPGISYKPVRFTIIDSAGNPVEGALVEASKPGPGNMTGFTDETGKVVLELASESTLHVHVSKNGYYTTGGELWAGGLHKGPGGSLVAREVPDSFTIEVKAVRNPVELVETRFRGRAPVSGKPIGFDLEEGDWVAPFGRGKVVDMLFHFHDIHVERSAFSGTMTLSFPNKGDGIQSFRAARPHSTEFGSNLAPPHEAPTESYVPTLAYTLQHRQGEPFQSYTRKERNYVFRTRTRLDTGGTLRQACYGYFLGEIEFDPRDPAGPQLTFTAFFNPDPDPEARSLESIRHLPRQR